MQLREAKDRHGRRNLLMAGCLESYRICCRCATVDLPDCIISDVRPNSDFFSVLDAFLRHFSINMSQSDLAVVVLIFSGRRLNIKDSVGSVFGTVPEPCLHVIIPPASVSAPVPQPFSPLSVASAAAQIQPRFALPSPSGSSDPFVTVPARALPDLLSAGAAAAPPFVASATPLSMATSQSVGASNVASLEAWASYYERVSLEWLQRWGVTRDPQALASHELAAQYALGCRKCLSENNSNHRSNLPTDNQSSYSSLFCNIDARTRIEVGGRAAAPGTISIAADQQRAAAPQVEIFPQAAAAPAQVANAVDAAAPVNPVVGGFGAGLLAIIVRAAVTMYILSSSQPNGRMGWAVFACIIIYLINSDRLSFLLKLVYPATRFYNALDPNAEPFVEPEWQQPGFIKGFLHLVLGFCVSIVPPPYAYADLN